MQAHSGAVCAGQGIRAGHGVRLVGRNLGGIVCKGQSGELATGMSGACGQGMSGRQLVGMRQGGGRVVAGMAEQGAGHAGGKKATMWRHIGQDGQGL